MKLKSLIILLLAGIWGVGSWWWYTCKVKGFCGAETTAAQVAAGAAATGAALSGKDADSENVKDQAQQTDNENADSDNDGVPDSQEKELGLASESEDSDGEGISGFIQLARDPQGTDDDGTLDALDDDNDNDGILSKDGKADPNGDDNVDDAVDNNGNQIAGYMDADADGSASGDARQAGADTDDDKQAEKDGRTDGTAAQTDRADQAAEGDKTGDDNAAQQAGNKPENGQDTGKDQAGDEKQADDSDKVTLEIDSPAQNDKDAAGKDIGPAKLYFPTGSANPQLADATKAYFDKVIQFLKDNDGAKVNITGHTDNQGSAARNKELGQKRADMIRQMLIDMGADKARVTASSEGEDKPIADNGTEEGRNKNRRVEITPAK